MLKSFKELYSIDISEYMKKKPTFKKDGGKFVKLPEQYWLDYIEWGTVVTLLYEHGAERVRFGAIVSSDGFPCFSKGDTHFVRVWVQIDDDRFEIEYPVINGNKVLSQPDSLDIHKAQLRAFVKAVAINTGLGLKLWQKEEMQWDSLPKDKQKKLPKLPKSKIPEAIKYLKGGGQISTIRARWEIDEETEAEIIEKSL